MLTIFVLDQSAESRNAILAQVMSLLDVNDAEKLLLPRIDIRPIEKHELKFHAAPQILIIGNELAASELSEIAAIKEIVPGSAILVRTSKQLENLSSIEQMARLGVDDTFSSSISSFDFVRKLILLAGKASSPRSGHLVLIDGGKGGVGVTSIAAALAEVSGSSGRKVAMIDFDFDTQDLSRFLQVRPFVNENLQLILEQNRPISKETVQQCLTDVWDANDSVRCMTPVGDADGLYDSRSPYPRLLLSLLEVLDAEFDCVIIDVAGVRGALQRALFRAADQAILVTSNDPAALYATAEKVTRVKSMLSVNARLTLVENGSEKGSLSGAVLREEINRIARIDATNWFKTTVPHCPKGARWPASGGTLWSCGSKPLHQALTSLAMSCGIVTDQAAQCGRFKGLVSRLRTGLTAVMRPTVPKIEEAGEVRLELPAPPSVSEELVERPVIQSRSEPHVTEEYPPFQSPIITERIGRQEDLLSVESLIEPPEFEPERKRA